MVKMGSFFVKKSESNPGQIKEESSSLRNFGLNESSFLRRKNLSGMSNIGLDKWDHDVRDNPQYVVEFVKEIFTDLKETEVII